MADRRLAFHDILCLLLGSKNVYFQPPADKSMKYPCLVYKREAIDSKFANDRLYTSKVKYSVTLIDADPDSATNGKLLELPLCAFERHFAADKLNHDVYNIYY